ncbi:VOC family protein [Phycisphaera mikurensis]|uniref:VOC domain-containing protein n=1 Tax=Phycisphaera mikurensis (strain NBRC 102666 / KCTC 22515 / FYK2301M01) TaxID=1142394 RepID=I0IFW4_PHYMF|nr:hypothetical protein PSMK_19930 [Phycisphaera mikurensis NBRC 102666]
MAGYISYFEIGADDAGSSRDFFRELFGWPFHSMGDGDEGYFETPGVKAGLHGGDQHAVFLPFFAVDDLASAADRVNQLGGHAGEVSEESGFGRFCMCQDPQGVRFGLHSAPTAGAA